MQTQTLRALRKVAVISGNYQVVHHGHIEFIKLSREFVGPNGILYVIVNNDNQSILKKGYSFVPEKDRLALIGALKGIDQVFLSIDTDSTVCKTIQWIVDNAEHKPQYFLNGGGQCRDISEEGVCSANNIEYLYDFGDKIQSTIWILENSVKEAMLKKSESTDNTIISKGIAINRHGMHRINNHGLIFEGKHRPIKCQYEV